MTGRAAPTRWIARILPLLAVPLCFAASVAAGQSVPAANTAAALKAAALARAAMFSAPGLVPQRVEIVRVEGDFAAVRLYPPLGTTDPALVIVQFVDGRWTGIIGPGTGGLITPDDPPGGPPLSLLAFTNPYIGEPAATTLGSLAGGLQTFAGDGFSFQYDSGSGAFVQAFDSGFVQVWSSALGPTTGDGFWFSVMPLNVTPSEPFDSWAYDLVQQEIARMQMQPRAGDPSGPPLSETSFHTGLLNVFQVDWPFGSDRVSRQLYVASKLGGPAFRLVTTLEATGDGEPMASMPAQDAVTLALNTLRIGDQIAAPPPGMLTYVDPFTGYAVQYPFAFSVAATDGYGAVFQAPDDGPMVTITPQTAPTLADAVEGAQFGAWIVESDEAVTVNGLPARLLTVQAEGAGPVLSWYVQLPTGRVLSLQLRGSGPARDAAQQIVASLQPLPASAGSAGGMHLAAAR